MHRMVISGTAGKEIKNHDVQNCVTTTCLKSLHGPSPMRFNLEWFGAFDHFSERKRNLFLTRSKSVFILPFQFSFTSYTYEERYGARLNHNRLGCEEPCHGLLEVSTCWNCDAGQVGIGGGYYNQW
jgi:hypothetical protein